MSILTEDFNLKKLSHRRSVREWIQNKVDALNKIVYDKNYEISKLSSIYFNKLKSAKRVCIVGNGPVKKNITHLLDKFDVIIRFNNYSKDTDSKLVGSRTEVQFMCLQCANQDHWITNADCIIAFEIHREKLFKKISDLLKQRAIVPPMDYVKNMKKISDMTRGFYAIASCLQVQEKINKDLKIYLIGFGGKGHHFDKNVKISHFHDEEKHIIKQLKKQERLIDLKDIDTDTDADVENKIF